MYCILTNASLFSHLLSWVCFRHTYTLLFSSSSIAVGLHYPCNKPQPEIAALGWKFWASEDYWKDPSWNNGGTFWGKILSQNYILMNMTSTISW